MKLNAGGRGALLLAGLAGLGLIAFLAARSGLSEIGDTLRSMSPGGMLSVGLLHVAAVLFCAAGLMVLADGSGLIACLGSRLVRDGLANLAPIVPGFDLVGSARALRLFGAKPDAAAAATIVDVSTEWLSQALHTIVGLLVLLAYLGPDQGFLWTGILAASILPAVILLAGLRSPRALSLLERIVVRSLAPLGLAGAASDIAAQVRRLIQDRRRFALATLLHLAGWFLSAFQVWAAARAVHIDLSPGAALALESLVYAARLAFFMVPWGAGVQEAGFVLVGTLFGIGEAGALALSLVLRARDVLFAIPGTAIWVLAEGRRWRHSAG